MRKLAFSALIALAAFATFTSAAWAMHNQDRHSENTRLIFNSQNPDNATNSDLAFWGNRAYQGDYGGFRIFDISNPAAPQLIGGMRCFGPQNDPVVWENRLLFLAIDRTLTGPQCGAEATAHDNPQGWEGVRIFDVSNPAAPQQVGAVYTDCGAHTITLNPRGENLHLWVSSYPLRPGPTCGAVNGPRVGRDPLHGVIQVIEVPVNNPGAAREIAEPPIVYPGDPDNRFTPSQHGLPGPPALELAMRACHDITVFVQLKLAAAACAEQSQLWRIGRDGIPDTANPIWVFDDSRDTDGPGGGDVAIDFHHSATFSWDGKVVNFIDESFGVGCPPVTNITEPGAAGPSDTGRSFFLSTATGRLLSRFELPRTESALVEGEETCYNSAHLGNVATAIGRYLNVNAWYMGGINVIDFTRPANPTEVAFYDLAPFGATGSDNWSAYHYEGPGGDDNGLWIYGTDGVHNPATGRGFEVFRTTLSVPDLTLQRLNPQTQERVFRCTARAHGAVLRANRRGMVHVRVRVLGQAVPGLRVNLSGAGVRLSKRTNARGEAVFQLRPRRGGALRIAVPAVPNMLGCRTTRGVRAAAPPLTGRG